MSSIKPDFPVTSPCRVAIVGEAPGYHEMKHGRPFVGESGKELNRMLEEAGIIREDCYITNVFLERPDDNKLERFCTNKTQAKKDYKLVREQLISTFPDYAWPDIYDFAPIISGKYLEPRRLGVLPRLRKELESQQPNVIIAAGNASCWATMGKSGIAKLRGTAAWSNLVDCKVVPIYHPAAVLRQWGLRSVSVLDIRKAARESLSPDLKTPEFEIWIEPTLADLEEFYKQHLLNTGNISVDIETAQKQITCVGFGTDSGHSLVVPFVDRRNPDGNYWKSAQAEALAWKFVKRVCAMPQPKILQNGMYDIQYLWKFGCPLINFSCDTMLLHHSMQPELPKALGFMASVYTNFPSWKDLRPKGRQFATLKKDE